MNAENVELTSPVRVSVCMATYKGAAYVREQILSILAQLGGNDELVIVDDASTDDTLAVVRGIADSRVRLLEFSVNQGYVRAFNHAVTESRGAYVFLADQDDVWLPGRLEVMLAALQETDVVASNFGVLGGGGRGDVPLLKASDSRRAVRNIAGVIVGYRPYYGCGMAMTRAQAGVFAPIPQFIGESHDLWLALCGNVRRSMTHIEEPTLLRRLHENNVTPRGWRSLPVVIAARVMILRALIEALRRSRRAQRAGAFNR